MNDSFEIRAAGLRDVPQLCGLVERYWQFENIAGFAPTHVERSLRRLISEKALGTVFVAGSDGVLVGYLAAVFTFSIEHRGLMAELDELFVVPELRGRGIGAALLAHAEINLSGSGCVRVQLQIAKDNGAARRFYRRHGYAGRDEYALLDKALAAP